MKIRCLVIDDEPPARELLASYIAKVEGFEIRGACGNALEAFTFLQKNEVDIIFLDIRMPQMSGLEFIRSLPEKPAIIFTTAYREYGADGFELDALDYLVKPISFDRFLRAIARYNQRTFLKINHTQAREDDAFEKAYMYFKVSRNLIRVFLKDIIYIESIKDYVKIVTENRSLVTYQRIGYMEEKLPENKFLRIHKSYIVARDKISGFSNDCVDIDKFNLPVGRSYKQKFMEYIEGAGLR